MRERGKQRQLLGIDKDITRLGVVSFLTDVSSEMIFAVFSIFFTIILGASTVLLGLVEGIADFTASSLDYIAGYLSDKSGKRKRYAVLGYGFSTLAKGILLFSSTVASAFSFRIIERLGKSFRGPPRDAWIGALSTKKNRGYAFGVHKTFDKTGAILGPLIAYWILSAFGENAATFKLLFWIAIVPAVLSVILLLFMKDKPEKPKKRENMLKSYRDFTPELKHYLWSAALFSLAYFSFSFLLLKAYLVGFAIKDVVLLYALFNVSFVLVAAPLGKLGDKIGRQSIIMTEYFVYFLMTLGFIFASTQTAVVLLFLLYGIFYALDESQSKAYITDLTKERRATAIGFYNFITGLIYLPASLIAGYLWGIGPSYAFGFAAAISLVTLLYFLLWFRYPEKKNKRNKTN